MNNINNIQHYKTLGLNPNASEEDIKKKYKKLALQYHPDRNKDENAEEKFKKISEAYNSLLKKNDQINHINDINDIFQHLFREQQHTQFRRDPFEQFFSTNINFHTMSNNNKNTNYSIPRITRSIIFENGIKKEKIVKIENNKEITTIITHHNNGKISKEVKIKNL